MSGRALKIDGEQIWQLGELAAAIASQGMEGLSENARDNLARTLGDGKLYLHVQLHPSFLVALAFDPNDPNRPPVEIARWQGEAPEAVKRMMN